MSTFEYALGQALFSKQSEKTFVDKILARQDVDLVRSITRKAKLSREDLTELLHLCSGAELKLLNYGEHDRYLMGKFFVWIREFVALAEQLYDYKEELERKEKTCQSCMQLLGDLSFTAEKETKKCKCREPKRIKALSDRARKVFDNNMRFMEHNIKFLVDLYFNLARSTMSLGATGALELLRSKFEIAYADPNKHSMQPDQARRI